MSTNKRKGFAKFLKEGFDKEYCFNKRQKVAILLGLYEIAYSDNVLHMRERDFFSRVATYLGLNISESELEGMLKSDKTFHYKFLMQLSESQRNWIIFTTLGMMYADGVVEKNEYKHLEKFLISLGFTRNTIQSNMLNEKYLKAKNKSLAEIDIKIPGR